MQKIESFEDILAWQKARILVVNIYKSFAKISDFGFRDQIQRASVSIMNNIAEGFERKGKKEFSKFLFIAKGSCGEVRSMLYLALELRYITKEEFNLYYANSLEISRMLSGLIKSISL